MFSAADAAGAPSLRGGVWAAPERGCDFDPNTPVDSWPNCANGVPNGFGLKPGEALMLIPGVPMIVQYRQVNDGREVQYFFGGMRPLASDGAGRVIAAQYWTIQCGPPRRRTRRDAPHGTLHPLPGLVMDPDGDDCTPRSAEAIRAAALPSRAWSQPVQTLHWVRDGNH